VKRIVLWLLVVPWVGGCAVSRDGIGFTTGPHAAPGGILMVGTTGPLRTLNDQERAEFYRGYLAAAASARGGAAAGVEPSLSAAEFDKKIAGWASIQTFSVPLVVNLRYRVLVPAAVAPDTHFASTAASFAFGASGDLVAARSDSDGLLWIDRVLCKTGRAYAACAQKYSLGVFDESTGRELGRDFKPETAGEWVDTSSYLRLSQDPEHHAASELDVRAINRCDDCKGALPGSVQSTVSIPPP
jgi:hypothetical protein